MGEKFDQGLKIAGGAATVVGAAVTIIKVFTGK